jgi:hypothetical protein
VGPKILHATLLNLLEEIPSCGLLKVPLNSPGGFIDLEPIHPTGLTFSSLEHVGCCSMTLTDRAAFCYVLSEYFQRLTLNPSLVINDISNIWSEMQRNL